MSKKGKPNKVRHKQQCKICLEEFEAKKADAKYCSLRCKNKQQRERLLARSCRGCAASYNPTTVKQAYCSITCALRHAKPQRTVTCSMCSREFTHRGRGGVKACPSCRPERASKKSHAWACKIGRIRHPGVGSGGAQWGKANAQWKGPASRKRPYLSYTRICYQNWPKRCVMCCSVQRIEVHHIDGDPANNAVSNLVPLCRVCHRKVHYKRHETPEQYEQALFSLWPQGRSKIAELTGIPDNRQSEVKLASNVVNSRND